MNKKDWASVTDEVIMDLERYGLKARKNHPNPIGLLIAEIKRLRADVERLREEINTSLEYIKRPDIDDDSHTLSVVKTVLEDIGR